MTRDLIEGVRIRPAAAPWQLPVTRCLPRESTESADLLVPHPGSGTGTYCHLIPSPRVPAPESMGT